MVAVHEKLFSIKFFAFAPGWDKEKPWAKFILRCILNHKEANTNVETDEPSNGYPNNDTNFKNEERISVVDRSEQESSNEGEEREQANVWDVHAASASTAMQDFADDFLVFLELVIIAHDMNIVRPVVLQRAADNVTPAKSTRLMILLVPSVTKFASPTRGQEQTFENQLIQDPATKGPISSSRFLVRSSPITKQTRHSKRAPIGSIAPAVRQHLRE
ncbi:uncharacterized protein EAF02_011445 [Botrytis sinoallii]|uniref:uncharacterized protein n=1 Tax=Botrytis sinoallii TaxID=1463999 RepID=UPI001902A40D|nr:uncharacterized protein EAF02_011445 [Botrytis sinoallii]KAF7856186.1 hypothetical protein EAF02_011445 [Botrytis sinoallii]